MFFFSITEKSNEFLYDHEKNPINLLDSEKTGDVNR